MWRCCRPAPAISASRRAPTCWWSAPIRRADITISSTPPAPSTRSRASRFRSCPGPGPTRCTVRTDRCSTCGDGDLAAMGDWLTFWNSPHPIYVNDLHRDVHYRDVALQIRALIPGPSAAVVDYGCGDTTAAHLVAEAAAAVILSDGAASVRDALAGRYKNNPKIAVRAPQEVTALPPHSVQD